MLAISGLGDKQIASRMNLAVDTVRTYWRRIKEKIDGQNRAEIIAKFLQTTSKAVSSPSDGNENLGKNLRLIADSSPFALCVRTPRGTIAYANNAWQRLTGLDRETWARDTVLERVGLGRDKFLNRSSMSAPDELPKTEEIQIRRLDGQNVWIRSTIGTLSLDGKYFIESLQDLTAQKRTEFKLREVRAEVSLAQSRAGLAARDKDFAEAILRTIGSTLIVFNRDGLIVRFNETCEGITDYKAEEVLGSHFCDVLIPPEDRERIRSGFNRLTPDRFPFTAIQNWLTKAGERRLIQWNTTGLLDSDGEIEFVISAGIDITESHHQALELEASNKRFNSFMEKIPGIAFAATSGGVVTFLNRYLESISNIKLVDALYHHYRDFLPEDIAQRNVESDLSVWTSGKPSTFAEVERIDGAEHHFLTTKFVFDGGAMYGDLIGGLALDVTDLRHAEQRLRLAAESSFDMFEILTAVRNGDGELVDFACRFANQKAIVWLSQFDEKCSCTSILRAFSKEEGDRLFKLCREVVNQGKSVEAETQFGEDGDETTIFISKIVQVEDGVAVSHRDVTHERQMERLVRNQAKCIEELHSRLESVKDF